MNTKLTLKLDQTTINRAKGYAKERKTSLSKMIENYLNKIANEENDNKKITPLVKGLSGIIKLPKDYNHKKAYADFLIDKYK
jgi:hypothetical protein